MLKTYASLCFILLLTACQTMPTPPQTTSTTSTALTTSAALTALKVATFNVSMEATNYDKSPQETWSAAILAARLAQGNDPQIANIAEILQRTRPDIVLLNEFDYIANASDGIEAFMAKYLAVSQNGAEPIHYGYHYYSTVNTGQPTDFDLDHDGVHGKFKSDAWGYGNFPGHYGMVLLSKYPIDRAAVRSFQYFKWADMPGALRPIDPATHDYWYNDEEWSQLRLSSKSHWDVPVNVNGKIVHILASHPTPPVFDGPEDRNGTRNHDEIRLWTDYLSLKHSGYIYDDQGVYGGLGADQSFVILGDQNAAMNSNARPEGILGLLRSPRVNNTFTPSSEGGEQHKPGKPQARYNTATWGMRADYVLPSNDLTVVDGGVFWPVVTDPLHRLVADRKLSSDHRLVWLQLSN